jgi:hypothetical protein
VNAHLVLSFVFRHPVKKNHTKLNTVTNSKIQKYSQICHKPSGTKLSGRSRQLSV